MNYIKIIEVGPRDGFQNLKAYIPVEKKIATIEAMIDAGVKHLQVTSFVSPKAIPQLKDAVEIVSAVRTKHPDLDIFALIPNYCGAESAHSIGLKKVTNVISLSASHNMANIRRTHDQSFEELEKIIKSFPDMEVCLDIATAFGCPFEGKQRDVNKLLAFEQRAYNLGVRTFNLCDTVGMADPKQVRDFIAATRAAFPDIDIEIHIHDTRGLGIVCTLAGIEAGVDGIQSTLGGLGGCPFAPGASGNTATEDVVFMMDEMGIETGINFKKILTAAKDMYQSIEGNYSGSNIRVNNTIDELAQSACFL
ncbi:hydroxymethylglutaryl-CoA lyase [Peptoniphilus equinus]|uniref:Hydroxymethylglutaryl-CoA lyase n=1 Tax=Peptoniphilus equinus TaxID=3016343 RepID=A0ABY7QTQ6_9FIRM|nr:hydroxymethylglutaryl-CoA lyase [Peptoniphilus equinus]WBW49390.1 hydroxymethylglutaryl-CoA lyase [Peptoniphilus equinus]